MSSSHQSWREFLLAFALSINARNAKSDLTLDLSVPEQDFEKSVSNLVSNKVSRIVCYFSEPTATINSCHSMTDLAGGFLVQASKVVALNGFGNTSFPAIVNNGCISKIVDKQAPKINVLSQLNLKEAVTNSTLNENNSELLSTHPFMLVPHAFLWKAVMEIQDRLAANVFSVA